MTTTQEEFDQAWAERSRNASRIVDLNNELEKLRRKQEELDKIIAEALTPHAFR